MLLIILPLVTIPYVSRVLGATGVGTNAYTNSIVQYFILLGTLGINMYGNRQIAYVRDDDTLRTKTFWGIFILKLITCFIAVMVYIISLQYLHSKYLTIFFLQGIYILAALVDISWFFTGIEDFKKTVTRNFFIKLLSLIFIFVFVKTKNDLWIYVLILGLSAFLGQLSLWVYMPRYLTKVKIIKNDISIHIIPTLVLFIPQIASQIYVVLDKTMLGVLSTQAQVGIYDNSIRIIKTVLMIITSIGIVMMPRISNLFVKKDNELINRYIIQTFKLSNYLALPMIFGFLAISPNFSIWFFGEDFIGAGLLMQILSPTILFIAWSSAIGVQLMLPIGKDREFTISLIIGAIVNIILNIILIPSYQAVGACIATVIAEFTVALSQILFMRRSLPMRDMFNSIWKDCLSGLIMFIVVYLIEYSLGSTLQVMMIQVCLGIITYIIIQTMLKSEMNLMIFNKLRAMVVRGK